jgi:hypothetical protein
MDIAPYLYVMFASAATTETSRPSFNTTPSQYHSPTALLEAVSAQTSIPILCLTLTATFVPA